MENTNVNSYGYLETTRFIVELGKVPNFSRKISTTIAQKL